MRYDERFTDIGPTGSSKPVDTFLRVLCDSPRPREPLGERLRAHHLIFHRRRSVLKNIVCLQVQLAKLVSIHFTLLTQQYGLT